MVAYLILIIVLVLIGFALHYFGVFDAVLPLLLDPNGTYGLSDTLIVFISGNVVLITAQVLMAFLVFEIVVSGRARHARRKAKKKFAEELTAHYLNQLRFRTSAPGPVPTMEGHEFDRRHDAIQRIFYRWTPYIESEDVIRAEEIDGFFEQLVFGQVALVSGEFRNRLVGLQFKMGLRKRRRIELVDQLKTALNRFKETRISED